MLLYSKSKMPIEISQIDVEESNCQPFGINRIIDIFDSTHSQDSNAQKYYANVQLNDRYQMFEVDSGVGQTEATR